MQSDYEMADADQYCLPAAGFRVVVLRAGATIVTAANLR